MEDKKYECKVCFLKFKWPSNLERHYGSSKHKQIEDLTNINHVDSSSDIVNESDCETDSDNGTEIPEDLMETLPTDYIPEQNNNIHNNADSTHLEARSQYLDEQPGVQESEWFPFPNKLSLLLYTLLHSQTHHVSDNIAKYFWYILKEAGVPNLPTFQQVKDFKFGDIDADRLVSKGLDENGVPYYILSPTEVSKLMVANPVVSAKLQRYPRIHSNIEEQFDAQRIKEMKAPWAPCRATRSDLFVGEMVKCDGMYGKILSFLDNVEHDVIEAELDVFMDNDHEIVAEFAIPEKSLIKIGRVERRPCDHLRHFNTVGYQIMEIRDNTCCMMSEEESEQIMVQRKPVLSIPINVFIDDTSTNISRRWLPMHCIQMQLAGLPMNYRQKEMYSQFLGATEKTGEMNLVKAVIDDIAKSQNEVLDTYDATTNKEICVKVDVAMIVADFNMLAEACNHMGAAALKFCPKCHADREGCCTQGRERTPRQTQRTVERLNLRSSEAQKKELRKSTGVKESINHFWSALNPHRDIPSGVLHLFHLGVSKHLIKTCLQEMNERQQSDLDMFLHALNEDQKILFDVTKYIDSRQGKDLKKLTPVAPFGMAYAGLNEKYLEMVCILAKLNKMVHSNVLEENDLTEIERLISKYLQCVEKNAPLLKNKVKTHLLTHMVDDIRRHGPPLSYSEDAFEKRHGNVRGKMFHQENQLARSRDTAAIFAKNYMLQHLLMGGFFKHGNNWCQSSSLVQESLTTPEISKFLGMGTVEERRPGMLLKPARNRHNKASFTEVDVFRDPQLLLQGLLYAGVTAPVLKGKLLSYSAVVTKSGGVVNAQSSILFKNAEDEMQVGTFQEGLLVIQDKARYQLVIIQPATKTVEPVRNSGKLGCTLVQMSNETVFLPACNVVDKVPLVHDCLGGRCSKREVNVTKRIEQEITNNKQTVLHHNKLHKFFFVNEFSLHLPTMYSKDKIV